MPSRRTLGRHAHWSLCLIGHVAKNQRVGSVLGRSGLAGGRSDPGTDLRLVEEDLPSFLMLALFAGTVVRWGCWSTSPARTHAQPSRS